MLTKRVREDSPWCFLYADDVVLTANSRMSLQEKLETSRQVLEKRGMEISMIKTKYMSTDIDEDQEPTIDLDGIGLRRGTHFK